MEPLNILFVGITMIAALITVYLFIRRYSQRKMKVDPIDDMYVVRLSRQCARWAIAARNDRNAMIATLHANYASGYLWAIESIVEPEQFERAMEVEWYHFKSAIMRVQDDITLQLARACPSLVPDGDLLLRVAKIGE